MVKGKREQNRFLALKAKKESSDEDSSTSDNEDEEYAVASSQRNKDDKNDKSERKCFKCGNPNHLIGECPKLSRNHNQRAYVGGSWSDSDEEGEEKTKDEKYLMAKASNEDLASLAYSQETEGPYHTDLPTPDDIHRFLQLDHVELNHTIISQNVVLTPNQILTKELRQDMKRWEELIRENMFELGGHRDNLPASLAHMLYCIVAEEQYNLAYFFVKRIECARATPTANLSCGIDHGKARHSFSSASAHHKYGSLYHQGDDDGASRASTPSPTTYLNSLSPLNYERYDIPTSSQQDDDLLFERQTVLLNQSQQIHEEVRGGFKSFEKAQ
ncbi:ribosomal protein L7Ae/L30e/S12e/Gadd45 [Tanacetum coccineum]